jgi:hypothetical protein
MGVPPDNPVEAPWLLDQSLSLAPDELTSPAGGSKRSASQLLADALDPVLSPPKRLKQDHLDQRPASPLGSALSSNLSTHSGTNSDSSNATIPCDETEPPPKEVKKLPAAKEKEDKSPAVMEFECGYCGGLKVSGSNGTDGRIRVRCECGGRHRDNKPRMHAKWIPRPGQGGTQEELKVRMRAQWRRTKNYASDANLLATCGLPEHLQQLVLLLQRSMQHQGPEASAPLSWEQQLDLPSQAGPA